jgi:hypothetical protein|tara:strand:+ start:1039 stop:1818 length:780 start_codon:yes stop_codon:yes gene_type:complete
MELLIKVNSGDGDKSYKDGDIVQAFSNDRILLANAQSICSVDNFNLDSVSGLRYNDTLLMKYMEASSLYKIERINTNSARRTNLLTSEQDTISNSPNSDGEAIWIEEYLTRRLRSNRHRIFGSVGSEVWYSGSRPIELNSLWSEIEAESDNLKQDNISWKFTPLEKRHFYTINCRGNAGGIIQELSGHTVVDRQNPVTTADEVIVARRKWQVPYWDISGVNVDDVRNENKEVDGRTALSDRPFVDDINVDKVEAGIIVL